MVAPIGKTNPETSFEALTFSFTHLIVTGRVELDEEVEKAVAIADDIALKCIKGLILVIKKNNIGNMINI
tara:strand:- start:17 stop:226 length:210 start_codon:yes stop_codon:yes gene_type:complete